VFLFCYLVFFFSSITCFSLPEISFTPPLVSFKETIANELDRSLPEGKTEVVVEKTADLSTQLTIVATPLPLYEVIDFGGSFCLFIL
jgi:hypothetical protein